MSVAAADEVRQQKCPDLFDFAAGGEARSHLAAAVAAIGIAPLLHGFFAIEEGDPDGIFSVLGAEQTGQLQHYGGSGNPPRTAHRNSLSQPVLLPSQQK